MASIVSGLQDQFHSAYHWVEDIGVTVQQRVSNQIQSTQVYVINFGQGCQAAVGTVSQACLDTINKVENFLYNNKETIFFTGCSLTTAYFAPHLFFPVVIASVVFRIELARNLKKVADYYLKDEHNPYRLNPKYDTCINTVDVTLGTIAALDALALGTLFMTNFWTVYLIPILGGFAAGNCAAKFAMNVTNLLGTAPEPSDVSDDAFEPGLLQGDFSHSPSAPPASHP